MKSERIMNLKIRTLGFNYIRMKAVVLYLLDKLKTYNNGQSEITPEEKDKRFKLTSKQIKKWASIFTVKDAILASGVRIDWGQCPRWQVEFRDKIMELGLTKIDWIALPVMNKIAFTKLLRALGKNELKKCSILLIKTPSGKMLEYLECMVKKESAEAITIGELLNVHPNGWSFVNFGWCVSQMRQKLLELGFKYEDGIFLQEGTRRNFVQKIMEEEKLDQKQAEIIADIAHKRGWIKKTADWGLIN